MSTRALTVRACDEWLVHDDVSRLHADILRNERDQDRPAHRKERPEQQLRSDTGLIQEAAQPAE